MLRLMILGIGAFIEEQKYAADADGNNANRYGLYSHKAPLTRNCRNEP